MRVAHLAGENVFYGDASQKSLLMAAGLKHARAIVTSLHSSHQTTAIIQQVRQLSHTIPVIVRCLNEQEVDFFYSIGASEVIPEAVEASLMLAFHLLLMLNMPVKAAYDVIDGARQDRYELLNQIFQAQSDPDVGELENSKPILYALTVSAQSSYLGKTLAFMADAIQPVRILRIRRGLMRLHQARDEVMIQAGDILIVHGMPSQIDALKPLM